MDTLTSCFSVAKFDPLYLVLLAASCVSSSDEEKGVLKRCCPGKSLVSIQERSDYASPVRRPKMISPRHDP